MIRFTDCVLVPCSFAFEREENTNGATGDLKTKSNVGCSRIQLVGFQIGKNVRWCTTALMHDKCVAEYLRIISFIV